MADVHARVLKEALRICGGSEERLAVRLGVAVTDIVAWLQGLTPPVSVYLESLDIVATGCCGMSGAFGHDRIHRDESRGIWELSWARWIEQDPSHVLATGYSCRSQAHRFAKLSPRHPAEILLAHVRATETTEPTATVEPVEARAEHAPA